MHGLWKNTIYEKYSVHDIKVPGLTLSPAGCSVPNALIQYLSSFTSSKYGGDVCALSMGWTVKSCSEWSQKLKC